jgi:hypothetical protein
LKTKVGPISPDGIFKIEFNQDHLVPEKKMEQFEFEKLFRFKIKPKFGDKIGFGRIQGSRRLLEEDETKEESDVDLDFNVNVLEHTPRYISFELEF